MFYGDILLQHEELGFSPLRIPPEILSARGEVKMSAMQLCIMAPPSV